MTSVICLVAERRRAWLGLALVAALAIVTPFGLDGAVAGATCLVAMLGFIGVCIYEVRRRIARTSRANERAGFTGWWWF